MGLLLAQVRKGGTVHGTKITIYLVVPHRVDRPAGVVDPVLFRFLCINAGLAEVMFKNKRLETAWLLWFRSGRSGYCQVVPAP